MFHCIVALLYYFVRHLYLATMTTLGFLTLGVTLSEKFQDARYSPLRALLFSSLGTGFFFFPIYQYWLQW